MENFKRTFRRILGLYRRSERLVFIVNEIRETHRYRRGDRRKLMDEAHLSGLFCFERPVERQWHCHLLAVLASHIGDGQWGDTLEIGCSAGVFTEDLAQRCRSVTALDISPVALTSAAQRCAQYPNVRFGPLDLARDEIPGRYDLIFIMDVLWLISGRKQKRRLVPKLANALRDGGWLVFSDSRMPKSFRHRFWSLIMPTGADVWVDILERGPGVRLIYKDAYPREGRCNPDYWDKLFALFRKDRS